MINNNVELKISTIPNAGNGVFVKKRFKQNEKICYYDGDDSPIETIKDFYYLHSNFDKTKPNRKGKLKDYKDIAQFINDGDMIPMTDEMRSDDYGILKVSNKLINERIELYKINSQKIANVYIKEDFYMYAKRDIEKGEELFYSYGFGYWISKILIETNEPLTRLFCLLMHNAYHKIDDKHYLYGVEYSIKDIFKYLKIDINGKMMKFFYLDESTEEEKIKFFVDLVKG